MVRRWPSQLKVSAPARVAAVLAEHISGSAVACCFGEIANPRHLRNGSCFVQYNMRHILTVFGILLLGFAGLKTYVVFHRPDIGPEMMADATFAVLVAIVCFAIGAKLKKRNEAKQ
jgi:hypothetical protein